MRLSASPSSILYTSFNLSRQLSFSSARIAGANNAKSVDTISKKPLTMAPISWNAEQKCKRKTLRMFDVLSGFFGTPIGGCHFAFVVYCWSTDGLQADHRDHHGRPRRHRRGGDRQSTRRPGAEASRAVHHLRDERAAALRRGRRGIRRLLVARSIQRPAPRVSARCRGRRLRHLFDARRKRDPQPEQNGRRSVDALLSRCNRRRKTKDR